jgi:hypothetical protein
MPGQLGLELQGAICRGVLLSGHGSALDVGGLTQKSLKRNFGVSGRFSLQFSNAAAKLRIFQQSTEASLGGMLRGLWVDALIGTPSHLVGIAYKGLC